MFKKTRTLKSFYFLTLVLAFALVASACTPKAQKQATDTLTEDTSTITEEVKVVLSAQNDSGQSGTATLTSQDGQTKVVINTTGAPTNIAQPAHIHLSSCATIGGVKHPLTSLINGVSETLVPASLDDLLDNEQLSINVHKSGSEVSVYVACGDLPFSSADTNDSAMENNSTDNQADKVMAGSDDTAVSDDTTQDNNATTDSAVKVFNVGGVNFAYDVTEIRVKRGDKVRINFTSTSGFHDWVVDEFDAKTERVMTGGSSSVEFVADKAGTFQYYCSVGAHRASGMVGNLIVE